MGFRLRFSLKPIQWLTSDVLLIFANPSYVLASDVLRRRGEVPEVAGSAWIRWTNTEDWWNVWDNDG